MAEELPEWKQEGLQVFEEVEQKIKEDEKKERWRKIKNLVNNKGYTLKEAEATVDFVPKKVSKRTQDIIKLANRKGITGKEAEKIIQQKEKKFKETLGKLDITKPESKETFLSKILGTGKKDPLVAEKDPWGPTTEGGLTSFLKKRVADPMARSYLERRLPGATMGLGLAKRLMRGESPIDTSGLTQGSLLDRAKTGYKGYNVAKNVANVLSGKGGIPSIGGALPLGAAAAAIYYLNKNRERFTGYPTQVAYEQARQGRIDADRVQMRSDPKTIENLKINWKRQGFSDDEIRDKIKKFEGDTVRLKADVKDYGFDNEGNFTGEGLPPIGPSENYGFDDSGSFTGEGFGDSSGPSEDYGFDDSGSFTGEGFGDSYEPPAPTHYDEPSWSGDSGDSGDSGSSDSGSSDSGSSDDGGWSDSSSYIAKGGLAQRAPRKSMLKGGRVDKALGERMDRPFTGRSRDI